MTCTHVHSCSWPSQAKNRHIARTCGKMWLLTSWRVVQKAKHAILGRRVVQKAKHAILGRRARDCITLRNAPRFWLPVEDIQHAYT